jgi:hypothetical protein
MKFDPLTNSHSTGTSVRDAACYVLWSLARAFSKEDLQPYSLQLARAAVDLAVGDREVSIRRAGSAAFQENVGRMVSRCFRTLKRYLDIQILTNRFFGLACNRSGSLPPWYRRSRQNGLLFRLRSPDSLPRLCARSRRVSISLHLNLAVRPSRPSFADIFDLPCVLFAPQTRSLPFLPPRAL